MRKSIATYLVFATCFILEAAVYGHTIELDNYKLMEKDLQTKGRYVYSDVQDDGQKLKNASIEFDMVTFKKNYDTIMKGARPDEFLRLYIVLCTSSMLEQMQYAVKENQAYLD